MSENKSIQLGLCCMNTILHNQKPPIMSSRSVTLKTLETKGFEPYQNNYQVINLLNNNFHIKMFKL